MLLAFLTLRNKQLFIVHNCMTMEASDYGVGFTPIKCRVVTHDRQDLHVVGAWRMLRDSFASVATSQLERLLVM